MQLCDCYKNVVLLIKQMSQTKATDIVYMFSKGNHHTPIVMRSSGSLPTTWLLASFIPEIIAGKLYSFKHCLTQYI